MSSATETAEASDAMRERVMRLSFGMSSDMLSEALDLIFKADTANEGRFTAEQFDRLATIAATTTRKEGKAMTRRLHIDGTDYADGGNLVSGEGSSPYWVFDEDAQDYLGPAFRWKWMARLYRWWATIRRL